jgi:hypothetical protein
MNSKINCKCELSNDDKVKSSNRCKTCKNKNNRLHYEKIK